MFKGRFDFRKLHLMQGETGLEVGGGHLIGTDIYFKEKSVAVLILLGKIFFSYRPEY